MDGTTAVVTGAADGLGAAVARAFGAAGAHVVLADRAPDRDDLEAVAEAVDEAGGTATAQVADVRDEFDVERLLETAARESDGGVDLVVAAATAAHLRSAGAGIHEASYAAFDDDHRTAVRGTFATFREAVPHLAPEGRLLVPVRVGGGTAEPATGVAGDPSQAGEVAAGSSGDIDHAASVTAAGAAAVARAFATDAGVAVGAVAVGDPDRDGPEDLQASAAAVRWAATEAPASALDGSVIEPDTDGAAGG